MSLGRSRGGWTAPSNGYLYAKTYSYSKRIGDSTEIVWTVGTVQFASAIFTIGGTANGAWGGSADSMLIPVAAGNGGSIIGVDAWFLPSY